MPHDDVLLRKLAADTGFDRPLGESLDWLMFGAAGNRATLWLKAAADGFLAAAAPADVVAEIGSIAGCDVSETPGPAEAVLVWRASTDIALDDLCRRIAVLGHVLPDAPLKRFEEEVERELASDTGPRTTERIAEVKQRVGQDQFRKALMTYWGGKCAITGVSEPALLRASHAKPWGHSTDAERLDVHNGLLLVAHLDAAFDAGLISVDDDGRVLVSERLGEVERRVLGVGEEMRVAGLNPLHAQYLGVHRATVFDGE